MECHPWFEVSDRRKIRFRNVQIKFLLVFGQGRQLRVLTSFDNFWPVLTSFDHFQPVLTTFDQFWLVLTSLDWSLSLFFCLGSLHFSEGGSLLLPTSVLVIEWPPYCIFLLSFLHYAEHSLFPPINLVHQLNLFYMYML